MAPLWSSVLETDKPTRLTHFSKQGLFILHMLRQAYTSPVTLYAQVNRGTHWLSPGDNSAAVGFGHCFGAFVSGKMLDWIFGQNRHWVTSTISQPWSGLDYWATLLLSCLSKSHKCYLSYYGLYILQVIAVLVFQFLDYFLFYFKESSLIFVTDLIQLAKHAKKHWCYIFLFFSSFEMGG